MTEGDHNQLFNRSYRYFYLIYHQNQDPNHLVGNVATLSFTYMHTIIKKKVFYLLFAVGKDQTYLLTNWMNMLNKLVNLICLRLRTVM